MPLSRRERFCRWLGPYDYNYPLIFSTIVALYCAQTRVYSYSYAYGVVRTQFILKSILLNILLGFICAGSFRLAELSRRSSTVALRRYILEIFIVMSCFSFAIYLFNTYIRERIGFIKTWGPNDTPSTFTSRFLFAIMFIAFTHNGMRSLKELLAGASALNNDLQGKYRTLIESDEEIRDQAARYIHDRVQAEITLVNVKLQKVGALHGAEVQESLHPAISRLEKIRAIDLKLVSQILTPNLEAEGLKGAIETLCEQYQSGVEYQILIDVDVNECDEELTLGIYRIVEQGIINAITHGPASKVMIRIQKSDSDTYLLEISDNGSGALNPKPGTGSVIIDAWCSILDGVKEIESEVDKGFTLRVRIPAKR